MARLDRLVWAAGFVFETYGVRGGVRTDDASLLPRLRACLPPAARPAGGDVVDRLYSVRGGERPGGRGRRPVLVYSGGRRWARTREMDDALDAFEAAVRLDVATDTAAELVFVHAGVVGWQGRAMVMPAPSLHGKSTLVEALVRAGAVYYSDEYAVIDGDGRVHPFARPIALREDGGRRRLDVAAGGGRVGVESLPIGWVVATRYAAGTSWEPRTGTPGEALLALLGNTVGARLAPAHTLAALRRAIGTVPLLESSRGEADETAAVLLGTRQGSTHESVRP